MRMKKIAVITDVIQIILSKFEKSIYYQGDFHYQNLFKCHNESKGILLKNVCNGIIDCQYGSDELGCEENTLLNLKDSCEIILNQELICSVATANKSIFIDDFQFFKSIKIYISKWKINITNI